ncbi:MAG: E3 binding domain-containing protein [Actinomycetota bacterium]
MTTGTTTVPNENRHGPGRRRSASADGLPPPAVRRLARYLGGDLTTVAGTGPGDRITRAHVKAAARRPTVPPAPSRTVALLVRAVAQAAREQPELNGTWRTGTYVPARAVHMAVTLAGTVGATLLQDPDRL